MLIQVADDFRTKLDAERDALLKFIGCAKLSEIPASKFQEAVNAIEGSRKLRKKP